MPTDTPRVRLPTACAAMVAAAAALCAATAAAQAPPPIERRPGDVRPELPPFEPPRPSPFTLPPVPLTPEQPGRLAPGVQVFLKRVEIAGNTALSDAELAAIARAYEGRRAGSAELEELRRKLTLAYVERGYINSGALLPDQEIRDGVVRYEIVEGTLSRVEITGNEQLRTPYLTRRILLGAGTPLNVNQLQERLQILQQDGLIERINAELAPGTRPGESSLKADVKEALPYVAGLNFGNRRPPSVGANLLEAYAAHRNLTGHGDALDLRLAYSSGSDDYQLGYAFPVNAHDTTVALRATKSKSQVIEVPFDAVDIRSETTTYQAGFTHPLWRSLSDSFHLGLRYEKRHSQTWLLGEPFSFSPGTPNGLSEAHIWRFSQDWLKRAPDHVMAARSTFSAGKTNAGPQVQGVGADASFLAWLGQFQYASRVRKDDQLIVRVDVQYSPDALISIEKIAVGGATTVRGYRENQIVRDNAVIASVEYRMPFWASASGPGKLSVAPFADYAAAWNSDQTPDKPRDIASFGVGLLLDSGRQLQAQLYAAKATRNFRQTTHDLQDMGIHFQLSCQFF